MYRYFTDLDFRWAICRVGWKCCRFNLIWSNRHESFPLLSIRHTGSQFEWDLQNIIVDLDFEGGLKMLSIRLHLIKSTQIVSPVVDSSYQKSICARLRKYSWPGLWGWVGNVVDSIELTRIIRIDWSLWPRFKNEEGSCIVISWTLTSGGLCRVPGLKMLSIWLDSHTASRFARDLENKVIWTLRVGWKCCWFDRIDTNRTNLLKFVATYINFQQQFWLKNVQLTGVSAMTKVAAANTCISVIFNQSYLGIPTLPNNQPHGRYMADANRLILNFHEINIKVMTKHEDKNPMRCLLENESKVRLQPRHSFFVFPKVDQLFFSFTWNADKKL